MCYRLIAIAREGGENVYLRGPEARRGTVTRPVSVPQRAGLGSAVGGIRPFNRM